MNTLLIATTFTASFNPSDPAWSFWLNVLTIAIAIIGPPSFVSLSANFLSKPRKQLSYQTESDAALVDQRKDLGEDMSVTLKGGALHEPTEVDDARLIMFKLTNTGADIIHKEDFSYDEKQILRFEFMEAKLILCSVHHTEPDNLIPLQSRQEVIHLDVLETKDTHTITHDPHIILPSHANSKLARSRHTPFLLHKHVDLAGRTLDKGDAIILKFVTQGKVKMNIQGRILGGKIVPYAPPTPIFTVPRVLLGLLLAFAIVFGINWFGFLQPNYCSLSFSPINISGSSAFYSTVQSQASTYHQGCPFDNLNVQSSDSGAGLTQLEQGHLDIADSEITPQLAGYTYTDLTEHQVAIIVFTIIINKQVTGVSSLSQDDITKIYNGQYTNWQQVKGPDMPIVLYGRPSGSGTQAAFTNYVLLPAGHAANAPQTTVASTQEVLGGVGATPGAIGYVDLGSADQANSTVTSIDINNAAPTSGLVENGSYPFWAIERMYTRQNASNPLALSFVAYTIDHIKTGNTFISIADMPLSVRERHK